MRPLLNDELSQLRERIAELERETERLRSDGRLPADAEGYWAMIRSAPIPMFVNFEGRIVLANEAAVSVLGAQSEGDLIGRSPLDFIHSDFHEVAKKRAQETVACRARTTTLEERFRRLDGTTLDVEVTVWPVSYAGQTAAQVMFTDISARKNAERALRERERIYRAIGEMIDYGVWICDPDGRNIYASESFLRLVGQTQEECSEFGWGKVLHPEDAERTIAGWKECAKTGGIWDIEHRFLGVDGKYHPILARGIPVRGDHGEIVCWAGLNLDISRLKRTEEELARSNADLERFADVVAHDLQAPLRSIAAFSQLLVQRFSADFGSEEREIASHIQRGIEGMDRLIRGLLEYSRATRPQGNRTIVDANKVVHSIRLMFRAEVEASKAEILCDLLPSVLFDEGHLHQVLQNLVGNALKYSAGRPRVHISAEADGDAWRFSVADNGPGIDSREREKVFAMFHRLQESVPGAGIGLAVCKRLIGVNGGRIWVEPAEGGGSRFCFTVPRGH